MKLTDETIAKINHFKMLMDVGKYGSSEDITATYNEVFSDRPTFRPVKNTQCGSCLRHRIGEMFAEMQVVLAQLEEKEI